MLWGALARRRPYPRRMSEETSNETAVSPERAAELLESGEAQLIDVRQDYEWQAGRIAGATHMPLERLPERAETIARDRPVILSCRSGGRSAMATAALRASGLNALNLEGGLEAWVEKGLPIDPPDGEVAHPRHDNS
jgi:hydroxyacylglutathione hydrolase